MPDVNLDSIIYWDPVAGASKYELRVLGPTSALVFPDAATGFFDNGLDTFFPLSSALAGKPLGQYTFQVRAQSPATALSELVVNYVGLSAPQNLRTTP